MKVIEAAKVIFSKRQGNQVDVLFRCPRASDASAMRGYINTLSLERTFIRQQGEQISLEEEEKYLDSLLNKISEQRAVQLLAFHRDHLIGIAGVEMQTKTEAHVGILAISVAKEWRRQGVGKLLMNAVLQEAVHSLPSLQIITLSVHSTNSTAIQLYRKCDFHEWGRLPKGTKHQEEYVDLVHMYKTVR
ncbi:MAG: GNAT family N-acetyltransferase [Verrucomicrobiota bacterium]|nr:GNAT family N-acetyltransferase [Verrucomicrobiota bacterium]